MDAHQSIDALDRSVTRWLEVMLMPILMAFVAGLLVMDWQSERAQADRIRVLMQEAAQARRELARAERHLVLYDQVCAPLLSMPLDQAPEILPAIVGEPPAALPGPAVLAQADALETVR